MVGGFQSIAKISGIDKGRNCFLSGLLWYHWDAGIHAAGISILLSLQVVLLR